MVGLGGGGPQHIRRLAAACESARVSPWHPQAG